MVADRRETSGCVRPLKYVDSINAVPDGNSWRELQLGEFFRKDINWPELLAGMMTKVMSQEKRRIYGSVPEGDAVTVKPDAVPEIVFMVNPVGFNF